MPIWHIISQRVPNNVYFYRPIIFLLSLSTTMLFAQSPETKPSSLVDHTVLQRYFGDSGALKQNSRTSKDLEQTEALLNKELKRFIKPFQSISYTQQWPEQYSQDFSQGLPEQRSSANSSNRASISPAPAVATPYTFSYRGNLQGNVEDNLRRESQRQNYERSRSRSETLRSVSLSRTRRPNRETYGVILEAQRSYSEGIQAFRRGDYDLATQIFIENRYTWSGVNDPYYLNWLLKSLLASRQLERIPEYLKEYKLQEVVLRTRRDPRSAELYYLIGRYYFSIGKLRHSRAIFIDYLDNFKQSYYVPHSYYWIARSLERESYLDEARSVYLLVVSYFSRHYLMRLAKYKAELISLYLLKRQAEEFLRSRGVGLPL